MSGTILLEKLRQFYTSTFDLEADADVCGSRFSLYGHFNADSSQYVLTKKARLWEANCQEHLFIQALVEGKKIDAAYLASVDRLLRERIEPEYVRHGQKLPPPNHMYTYLTVVLLTDEKIDPEVINTAKKYKFEKLYRFNVRGYMETRLVLICAAEKQVTTNGAGKKLAKAYQTLLV